MMKKIWIGLLFITSFRAAAVLELAPFEAENNPSRAAKEWARMTSYTAPLSMGIYPTPQIATALEDSLVCFGDTPRGRFWFLTLLEMDPPSSRLLHLPQETTLALIFQRLAQVYRDPTRRDWFDKKITPPLADGVRWADHLHTLQEWAELALVPHLNVIESLLPVLPPSTLHQLLMRETGLAMLPYPWIISLYAAFPPQETEDLNAMEKRTGRPWDWWKGGVASSSSDLTDGGSPSHKAWVAEMQKTHRPGWYKLATLVRIPLLLRPLVEGFLHQHGLRALLEGCYSASQIRSFYEEWATKPQQCPHSVSPTPRRRFVTQEVLPVWTPAQPGPRL